MKQPTPMMIREILLGELIRLHKSIEKKDYKKAKLNASRIQSLCIALTPSHNLRSVKG